LLRRAAEQLSMGLTVNTVPPGFIDTLMMRAFLFDIDAIAEASPTGHPASRKISPLPAHFSARRRTGISLGRL
jgi:hypothetical protein